jgi:hypothetical protein
MIGRLIGALLCALVLSGCAVDPFPGLHGDHRPGTPNVFHARF